MRYTKVGSLFSLAGIPILTRLFPLFLVWGDFAFSQTETYPAGLISIPSDGHFSDSTFVVDKDARKPAVYKLQGDLPKKFAEHPADIGKNHGPKERANDYRTPVGIYFLGKELTQPEIPFDLYGNFAFVTDYPNVFDQRDAKTGKGIWLHAVPDKVPLTRGSRGCVVVRNDVIKDLRGMVKTEQTPMMISEQIDYLSEVEYKNQRASFLKHFEDWRSAWENQDVDKYMKYYDVSFRNDEMNFGQWYKHKKRLKQQYAYIKVQLSQPLILMNKDQVVIRSLQRYESNLHKDYGEKTIHARLSDETGFKIIREDWVTLPDPAITLAPMSQSAEIPRAAVTTK